MLDIISFAKAADAKSAAIKALELPNISSSNNGSVLTVVNGAWDAAPIPEELPVIDVNDNGKVLTAVNSSWVAQNITFNGGILIVTETVEEDGELFVHTLNKTYGEIITALQNNILPILLLVPAEDSGSLILLSQYTTDPSHYSVVFGNTDYGTNTLDVNEYPYYAAQPK